MKKRERQRKKFLKRVEELEKKYGMQISSIDGWYAVSYYDTETETELRREDIMNPNGKEL